MEIVADLACKLRDRDTTFRAVGLIGLEILAAEAPNIGTPYKLNRTLRENSRSRGSCRYKKPSVMSALISTADIPGRHRWAIARPPKRVSMAAIIIIAFS